MFMLFKKYLCFRAAYDARGTIERASTFSFSFFFLNKKQAFVINMLIQPVIRRVPGRGLKQRGVCLLTTEVTWRRYLYINSAAAISKLRKVVCVSLRAGGGVCGCTSHR